MNPLSQQMQAQGRGNDSVLVHMSPREVGGLQALAMAHGGSLTTNPQTGLPEAGFLDSILPAIAGAVGGAMGVDPWMAAAGAGLVQGAITGNLEKGLTAGLSAYGGASLGRSFNPEGTFFGQPIGTPIPTPSLAGIDSGAAHGDVASSLTPAEATTSHSGFLPDGNAGSDSFAEWTAGSALTPPTVAPTIPLNTPTPPAPQSMFDKFGAAASAGITNPNIAKFAPYAAALGLATPFLTGSDQTYKAPEPKKTDYAGPYKPVPRVMALPVRDSNYLRNSSEHMFFPDSNPYPGYLPADKTTPESEIDLNALAKRLGRVAPTIRMAEGGLLPRAAPRTGLTAPETPRYYGERTFNFPKSNYVPPAAVAAAPPSAGLQALTQQYPTATKAQVSELDRMIQAGGDPGANLSLMQAYSPAGSIKELQPWAKEYKGDAYRDSHPVDAFGNPIGWSLPAQTAPTTDANGVPSGWDPRDWENMKNFNPGMPDPEYIMNNPWMGGMQFGPAPLISQLAPMSVAPSSDGKGNTYTPQQEPQFTSRRLENAYGIGLADKAAREAGAANNQTALNYALYGGPDAPEGAATPEGFAPKTSSGSSTFLGALNSIIPSLSGSSAATRAAPSGQDYSGIGGTLRGLMDMTGGQYFNLFRNLGAGLLPGGTLLNQGIGALQGATNVRSAPGFEGNNFLNYLTSGPSSEAAGANVAAGNWGGALRALAPFNILGKPLPTDAKAAGGVNLEDGSFVVDARTVAELGNGSSGAGQEVLARLGGRPIHGPGDGVSDSIRANIGGTQEARVARDEVKFSPEAVKRLGRGNPKKGADRLYDMMKKAEKARKSASRGKDTGLRALAGAR